MSPLTIYDDDQVFDIDSINIVPNMEVFLEILNGMIYVAMSFIYIT